MKKPYLNIYSDGIVARYKNRRIQIRQLEDKFILEFDIIKDKSLENTKTCEHKVIKGVLHNTAIALSLEAMELIHLAYQEYKLHNKDFK